MTNNNDTSTPSAGFVIDMTDPLTRQKVVLATIISALAFELNTGGMKIARNVNPLATLKRDYPTFKGNKKAGLQFAIDTMKSIDPDYKVSTMTLKAIS